MTAAPTPTNPRVGTRWPDGAWNRPHEELATFLLESSRWHARTSLKQFTSEDTDERLQAAISVGCSVELLAKAVLASHASALLADRGDPDSVLHFSDLGHLAEKGPTAVRSRSAYDALTLARRFAKSLQWNPVSHAVVFEVRNAAVHMAIAEKKDLFKAVQVMVLLVHDLLAAVPRTSIDDYWGKEMSPVAGSLLDRLTSETAQVVEAKLAAARGRYAELTKFGVVAAQEMIAVLASRAPRTIIEMAERATCPVCGNDGWLNGDVEEGEVLADEEEGILYIERFGIPMQFECSVCMLSLEVDELSQFSFPERIELEHGDYEEPDWEPDWERF